MTDGPGDDGEVVDFGILSLPLPKIRWVYEPTGEPPDPLPELLAIDGSA